MQLARQYKREHTDEFTTVLLDEVSFSRSRSSFVAKAVKISTGYWNYEVIDILGNIEQSVGACNMEKGECGGGRDMDLTREQNRIFDWFVSSDSQEKAPLR